MVEFVCSTISHNPNVQKQDALSPASSLLHHDPIDLLDLSGVVGLLDLKDVASILLNTSYDLENVFTCFSPFQNIVDLSRLGLSQL